MGKLRKILENIGFIVLVGVVIITGYVFLEEYSGKDIFSDMSYSVNNMVVKSSVIWVLAVSVLGLILYVCLWFYWWGEDDEKRRNKKDAKKEKQKLKTGQITQVAGDLVWRYKGILALHKQYLGKRKDYNESQTKNYGKTSGTKKAETEFTKAKGRFEEAIAQLKAVEKDALKNFEEDFAFLQLD